MEATGIIDTDLVAVTGTLIAGTLVNVDALVPAPPESHLATDLLHVTRQQRIVFHRLPKLCLLHTLVVSLRVHTDHSRATRRLHQALVNVWGRILIVLLIVHGQGLAFQSSMHGDGIRNPKTRCRKLIRNGRVIYYN